MFNARNVLHKAISVSGNNNAGVWRRSLHSLEANGVGGGSPDAAAILQLFSKKYAFLGTIWSNAAFSQEQNLTFVKKDFQVLKLKFHA